MKYFNDFTLTIFGFFAIASVGSFLRSPSTFQAATQPDSTVANIVRTQTLDAVQQFETCAM